MALRPAHALFPALLLTTLAACGGPTPAPEEPLGQTTGGESSPPPSTMPGEPLPDPTWSEMSHDEKKGHMMEVVVPELGAKFKAFSADHFSDFGCATCHGPGAKEGKFEMPSADLPKLPPNGQFEELMKAKPEVMDFMMKEVVPAMAQTIDMEPYNPETHEGFGCYGCHQSE